MLIDFCLPVKDEEKILEANAIKIYNYLNSQKLDYDWRIVIIVNGSTDDSYQIAQDLESKYGKYFKAINIVNRGKGLALKEYFKDSEADILSFMDIDLAVSLEDLPNLINPIIKNESDLVIGSRLLPDSRINRSNLREFGSRSYNRLSRALFKHNLTDLQCGFKAFKKEVYHSLRHLLRDDKWFFDTEFVLLSRHFGYRVKEIPVDWQESRFFERKSKVRKIEAYHFVKKLIKFKRYIKKIKR
ncbi:MAG: glycosyltransferase [Patescibacteria group bacterium]